MQEEEHEERQEEEQEQEQGLDYIRLDPFWLSGLGICLVDRQQVRPCRGAWGWESNLEQEKEK